ncbi:MAG: mannose-1-phosphate guanylyltransferase [Calditrichaceae bacterium]
MYIVLMAGGVGSRFWPKSREAHPKQFLKIFGERSMLQMTYDRIRGITPDDKILVITNMDFKEQVHEQLPEIPVMNIIGEPFGRGTAPCIGLASAIIMKREENDSEVMAVLPADHLIENVDVFRETLLLAEEHAKRAESLITIGIKPTYPETGYGYIQKNAEAVSDNHHNIYKVKTFAEKPNKETADRFLQSGDFLWNSGMFIWTVGAIMQEFDEHLTEFAESVNKVCKKVDTKQFDDEILDVYSRIKSISIDYGIMEVAKNVCVIEADFKWNDVGSWESVHNISKKDDNGNAIGAADHVFLDARNNYVSMTNDKLIALVDVSDLAIVETDDVLLVCRKDESQRVKDIVDALRRRDMTKYL